MGKNGETILHIAARSKAVDEDAHYATQNSQRSRQSLLIYLLSKMTRKQKPLVDIDMRDNQGRTALHHSIMNNRITNVKLLLKHRACITVNIYSF